LFQAGTGAFAKREVFERREDHLERCPMDDEDKIVAVSFLTLQEWKRWGSDMKRIYPLPDDWKFDDLLRQLDLAEPAPER